MNPINGMVMVPVMTPYGTQLIPMTMEQVMSQYGGNQHVPSNKQTSQQQQQQQPHQAHQQNSPLQQQHQLLQQQQLRMQQQLQAAQLLKSQQAMNSFGIGSQQSSAGNPIVNSILQQQAQLILNQQKLDEVKKLAKATKAAIKQNKAAINGSVGTSSGKGCYGTIGDLRYRSGTSSGFSSGSTDPSDSDGSSGISSSHYKNFKPMKMLKNDHPQQHSSSNTSSGWSCGSDDDGTNHQFNPKFNIKSTEQRSGSKAAFLQKMVEVLESYFNDEGLKRNQFLMKQLQTNPDGIPLKKIASMRRVKVLTRDLLTVASAVRRSTLLELSRDGTLVKRVVKPACLEPPKPIQTVLAINLEMDTPTVESVTNLFAKYGELTQIRIIRPSSSLPTYLKEFTMWVPDLGVNPCAIVEFETQEQAQAACREINMINRADGKLRVALLKPGARIRRTLYRKYKEDEELPASSKKSDQKDTPKGKGVQANQKKQKTQLNLKVYNSKLTQLDSGNGSDGSAEASQTSEDEVIVRPSVTKRQQKTREIQQIIRQPIGPDGTRGFNRNIRK